MTTPNAELAYRVLDHIDAHPEQWRQGRWITRSDCGTAACFAGWTVLLSGCQLDAANAVADGPPELIGKHVAHAADALLGLGMDDTTTHGDPFDGLLSRKELGRMVEEIFGPRPAGGQ